MGGRVFPQAHARPEIFDRLRDVDLHSLQIGMDNVRNICGCALIDDRDRQRDIVLPHNEAPIDLPQPALDAKPDVGLD